MTREFAQPNGWFDIKDKDNQPPTQGPILVINDDERMVAYKCKEGRILAEEGHKLTCVTCWQPMPDFPVYI